MQFRNLVALAVLVTLIGAGCQTPQPEKTLVLTRPPAGAYRDPDPTYGMPVPLKVFQASDFRTRPDDERQKTPQWAKQQVTVGSFLTDDGEGDYLYRSWNYYENWREGFASFPWQDESHTDLIEMVNGTARNNLSAPVAGWRVFLLITGPWVPSGQSWFPVEVWRDGSTITVVVEEWYDQLARSGNIDHRGVQLLSIGKLPQGDYTLRLQRRLLELDQDSDEFCYRWVSTETRSMPFRVLPSPQPAATTLPASDQAEAALPPAPPPLPAPAPVLDIDFGESDRGGRAAPGPAASVHREWPVVRPFRLTIDDDAKGISHWLRVGTFNAKQWEVKPDEPAPSDQRPRLGPPDLSDRLYASVVCPVPLRDGEWVALRKVIRSGRDVTLHLDLVGLETADSAPGY